MRIIFLLFCLVNLVSAGCYQKRLCCSGRNNTCKGLDDGINHLPTVSTIHNEETLTLHPRGEKEYPIPHYESADSDDMIFPGVFEDENDEKIGKLILPDIIELDGSGADYVYRKTGINLEDPTTTTAPSIHHFIVGPKQDQKEPVTEVTRYSEGKNKHVLIRFSTLAKIMTLRVFNSPLVYEENRVTQPKFQHMYGYLESGASECYCDEHCVQLGDCCSDYTFTCPPRDCILSAWEPWHSCKPDKGKCGIGTQKRIRHILQHPERGGGQCEPKKEMKTCFVDCSKSEEDITTVALILDYRYNETRRQNFTQNSKFWDIPLTFEMDRKNDKYYCVHYQIDWVNRNCVSRLTKKGLMESSIICAECQPEATKHRKNGRCASDLEDNEEGFWKLIGPKSCNGIWKRINRTENCHCQFNYPNTYPFLLV
ncbi:unnamed protein product [Caenorhabditis angaria]|uniref:SMB domain-containing protein n=1 Tax=Caenorhabditis angaria TaxID=860376 RepID=A0A9P1IJ82_9PELO|nr:unnamed protein product [Caenorhabditis angaria]